jgi:hypothetical protein
VSDSKPTGKSRAISAPVAGHQDFGQTWNVHTTSTCT